MRSEGEGGVTAESGTALGLPSETLVLPAKLVSASTSSYGDQLNYANRH